MLRHMPKFPQVIMNMTQRYLLVAKRCLKARAAPSTRLPVLETFYFRFSGYRFHFRHLFPAFSFFCSVPLIRKYFVCGTVAICIDYILLSTVNLYSPCVASPVGNSPREAQGLADQSMKKPILLLMLAN